MKNTIEDKLSVLVGKHMRSSGYCGLQWFDFGDEHVIENRLNGTERVVGEFTLHVSTAWRITNANGIVTGSQDYFHPAGEFDDDFNYDSFDPFCDRNRVDAAIEILLVNNDKNLVVSSVVADQYGSVALIFEGGYSLEIIPMDSIDRERWRFFSEISDEKHFVVHGTYLEGV